MPHGKFFFLRHLSSSLVLEIEQGKEKSGTSVAMGYQLSIREPRQHQLWYLDHSSSTIRSRLNDMCIDLKDDLVVVETFKRRSPHQLWQVRGSRIQNKDEQDTVIALLDSNPTQGASLHAVDTDGSDREAWDMDHVTAEYFYIRSQDNERVLDVASSDDLPGAKVIMYPCKEALHDNQLWYEDIRGVIRSKLNGFALTAQAKPAAMAAIGSIFKEDDVCMQPFSDENPRQQWIICGPSIQNHKDAEEVMEYRGGGWFTNPYICPSKFTGSSSQLWFFDYIPNQTMSLSHPGIGKYVRIMSRLSGHFLTLKDGSVEAGTPIVLWDRKSETREATDQLWYIDEHSGTIRSALNDYCIDLNDNHLIVNPFSVESRSQQWKVSGAKIYCACHPEKALQVEGNSEDYGAAVTISLFRGVMAQLWEVQNVPARCFYIKSFACDKIMGVKDENRDSGGLVAIFNKKSEICASQLWYEDENGYIRSTLNGYVMDTNDDSVMKLRPYKPGDKNQHWTIQEDTIQHEHDHKKVLDIKRGWTLIEGTSIVAIDNNGKNTQRWYFEYL